MRSIEAIIGTGVDDNTHHIIKETEHWPDTYGINVTPHGFGFSSRHDYATSYSRFLEVLDDTGATAIIGISGFGSVAINGLYDRADQVNRVINICGRLRRGGVSLIPLNLSLNRYPSFADSLIYCEYAQNHIDQRRVMTMRPYIDEVVPTSTVTLPNAKNVRLNLPSLGDWLIDPTSLHNYYSRYALRDYGDMIADFIQEHNKK